MSKEAMEAVLANSKANLPLRGILLALAWKTYDRAPPFTGPFTVRYIAMLANVKHRQAQTHIANLRKLGELVVMGKLGREYVYGVNITLANYAGNDVDNYAGNDVDNYANYAGNDVDNYANYAGNDVDNYAGNDVDNYANYAGNDVVTTQYPAFGSYKETRNKIITRGVTSEPRSISFDENLARDAEAEQTSPPPPPPLPSAADAWRRMREVLRQQIGGAQYQTWFLGTTAEWVGDEFHIAVRTSHAVDLLSARYSERIQDAARTVIGSYVDIAIVCKGAMNDRLAAP